MEEYYYLDGNNERKGPVALENLASHGVTKETMVWKQGMENWQAAGMVPEVIAALSASGAAAPVPPVTPAAQPAAAPYTQPAAGGTPFTPRKPDSNLVWAILSTLFCCLPLGIVSIVYASKVDSAWNAGDYLGAEKASKNAATYAWVSAGIGIVGGILYGILMAVGIASGL